MYDTALSELSIEDLGDVLEEIWEARSKWCQIGLALKLSSGTLDAIKKDPGDAGDHCMKILESWLTSDKDKTWECLAKAMERNFVGHASLSQDIRTKHCQ